MNKTSWLLLLVSLAVSVALYAVAGSEYRESRAFRHASHEVTGRVIVSDCWTMCRGGPAVQVSYQRLDGEKATGWLNGVDHRYRVGDPITVLYSDSYHDDVVLPPANPYLAHNALWSGAAATAFLGVAFAAWAVPANLRRLDRRDARRLPVNSE